MQRGNRRAADIGRVRTSSFGLIVIVFRLYLIKLYDAFEPISQSINIALEIRVILSAPHIYQIHINHDLST